MYIAVACGAAGLIAGVIGTVVACCRRKRPRHNKEVRPKSDPDYLTTLDVQMEKIEGDPRYTTADPSSPGIPDVGGSSLYMEINPMHRATVDFEGNPPPQLERLGEAITEVNTNPTANTADDRPEI